MKIDPKYFNLFVGIVAAFCLIAIIFFTLRYSNNQKVAFIDGLGSGQNLYNTWFVKVADMDSLRPSDFPDRYVIIDFWATWSKPSVKSHTELWDIVKPAGEEVIVIAAGVRDHPDVIQMYADELGYTFEYVLGTTIFQELLIPGVPTQILFGPGGRLLDVRIGYKRPSNYHTLRTYLESTVFEQPLLH